MGLVVPISKDECCGCTACVDICPVNAITMKSDEEGFSYPKVDETKCIQCGLCEKSCSFAHHKSVKSDITSAYVAKHRDQAVRMHSRSGGIFVATSDWILQMQGVVYGCVLDENLRAVHIRADSKKTRDLMCKSKYVQSDMNGIIPQIEKDLMSGRYVLFSGTGCQVEGVLSALYTKKVDCTKLYTIDIVCHGVPSPLIFGEYIKWLEDKYKGPVTSFDFRDKEERGWDGYIESYRINGKKYCGNIYRGIFNTDLSLRPACYNCKYCTISRNSDLTIGDAWGIKAALPDFNDNRGVSMFLVQSIKGQELLKKIMEVCETVELPLEKMMQQNLKHPSKPVGNRTEFWNVYYQNGFPALVKRYGTLSFYKKLKEAIKYQIRRIVQSSKYYLP